MTKNERTIIRYADRTHTFRILMRRKLLAATAGLANGPGEPVHLTVFCQHVLPEFYETFLMEVLLTRRGAWLGLAVPLTQGTIPAR